MHPTMKKKQSRDEQVELVRDLLLTMTKSIAEHEDKVSIHYCEVVGDRQPRLVVEIHVHQDDLGLVLGRDGQTADFMRQISYVACKKTDLRVEVSWGTSGQRR